jgi:hypothetical protein
MNQFREKEVTSEPAEAIEQAEEKQAKEPAQFIKATDFSFYLSRENSRQFFPFMLFLVGLAFFYIANTHYAERTIRETDKLSREIKELRAEAISIESDLMFNRKQSQVARMLEGSGIKELRNPPRKISRKEE